MFKAIGVDGITLRRVRAEWTNGPDTDNGAYGLYPVQCKDVLIEDSVVRGRVRRRHLRRPVAQHHRAPQHRRRERRRHRDRELDRRRRLRQHGDATTPAASWSSICPACRSTGAHARLRQHRRSRTTRPTSRRPGNIVAAVPTGTGMFMLANDQVEVFGNTLHRQQHRRDQRHQLQHGAVLRPRAADDPQLRSVLGVDLHPRQHLQRWRHGSGPGRPDGLLRRHWSAGCRCRRSPTTATSIPTSWSTACCRTPCAPACRRRRRTFVNLNIPSIVAGDPHVGKRSGAVQLHPGAPDAGGIPACSDRSPSRIGLIDGSARSRHSASRPAARWRRRTLRHRCRARRPASATATATAGHDQRVDRAA